MSDMAILVRNNTGIWNITFDGKAFELTECKGVEQAYQQGFEEGKKEGFKWLSIEKLKIKYKDEKVLAIDNHEFYYLLKWDSKTKGFYDFQDSCYKDFTVFTHFMPLPQPPQEQE